VPHRPGQQDGDALRHGQPAHNGAHPVHIGKAGGHGDLGRQDEDHHHHPGLQCHQDDAGQQELHAQRREEDNGRRAGGHGELRADVCAHQIRCGSAGQGCGMGPDQQVGDNCPGGRALGCERLR